ncbi:MAG: RNA polymerase sigma factor region1.1 domain-containing protein, partial [Steroidobacteraceae bacterium]
MPSTRKPKSVSAARPKHTAAKKSRALVAAAPKRTAVAPTKSQLALKSAAAGKSQAKTVPVKHAVKAAPATAKSGAAVASKPVAGAKSHLAPPPAGKSGAAAKGSALAGVMERRLGIAPEDRQSQLKLLIARGKEQGYLTYAQVNDHLPSEIVDPEQIEDIVNTSNDMGIPVYEKAPDSQSLLASDPASPADEEAIEEAAAALAALDAELGRTTDPVRMYMREMGTVELLTREGEIRIAKRIEEG